MSPAAFAYAFDHPHGRATDVLDGLLGATGARLAQLTASLGPAVPPGFTITSASCARLHRADAAQPDSRHHGFAGALHRLEQQAGRALGDPADPLLVAVRPSPCHPAGAGGTVPSAIGARAGTSAPGGGPAVLDVGLNDETVEGLAQRSGRHVAFASYHRFVQRYAELVLGVPSDRFARYVAARTDPHGDQRGMAVVAAEPLAVTALAAVQELAEEQFPQDPQVQLRRVVEAMCRPTGARRDRPLAVCVQAMVYGNRDERSGAGVVCSRHPSSGRAGPHGAFAWGVQGDELRGSTVTSGDLDGLCAAMPALFAELAAHCASIERDQRDMVDVAFTVESGRLWVLQARPASHGGATALRAAVAMVEDPGLALERAEALLTIPPRLLEDVLHPAFAHAGTVITRGLAASPGAAVGRAYFSADAAFDAFNRGEDVILVRAETSPEDVHGMEVACGILTSRGGLVSHAAVVARGWGIPAVVGAAAVEVGTDHFVVDGTVVAEGAVVAIDGGTGDVMLDGLRGDDVAPPPELDVVLGWADDVCGGHIVVRANADTAADARRAIRFGAVGIGLCRTEHMFLGSRLPLVRRAILATTVEDERRALEELGRAQRADFEELLAVMDGVPVTVRLLDPPLHEFLPSAHELSVAEAAAAQHSPAERALLAAARSWQEQNPMLGTRGVRLAVIRPELYRMQVRALVDAALSRRGAGGDPIVEVMVPLVVSAAELAHAHALLHDELERARKAGLAIRVGTMVETPRAALVAGELAVAGEFFSIGTNDLTQLTFGFSRDDVEARIMARYLDEGLLDANPFETLDGGGVGVLVRLAVEAGRAARPGLDVGVCGEHGGDPASLALLIDVGVDHVSVSPYRVPVTRLAAAQALIRASPARRGRLGPP